MMDKGRKRSLYSVQHFVYQRVNVLAGRTLHFLEHITLAGKTFQQVYGFALVPDRVEIAAKIEREIREKHAPARTSAIVMLRFRPKEDCFGGDWHDRGYVLDVEFERGLLMEGYAHSPLRPRGVTFEYSIPYEYIPTCFQLQAQAFFDFLSPWEFESRLEENSDDRRLKEAWHGAVRAVRRCGDRLISCGDAPIFAIRGRTLIAPTEGVESVERALVIASAVQLKKPLQVCREPILCSKLKSYDELFFADAAGITSFSECDGAKFSCQIAENLVLG